MRLAFSTGEFVYAGLPRPGFPLIIDDDMGPAQPFHSYLRSRLLEQGTLLDPKTWEAYGRRLWDFARFLQANELVWNQPFDTEGSSVVRRYRDWQMMDLALRPTTVNARLRLVADFYLWAWERALIDRLPFKQQDTTRYGVESDLSHITGGRCVSSRPDVLVDEWDEEPAFLTSEQIRISRASIRSTSQRLLFDLMCRVGLRSEEARTFPRAYAFDPAARPDLKPGTLIDVRLDPKDMDIKLGKPRVVHVPYSLMEELYAYACFERNVRLKPHDQQAALVLTAFGNPYSKESAVKVMVDLSRKVGFRVRPLMLRHSYAIYTLLLLRAHPEVKIEPLIYVRDRLGHRSVQTTMIYLRQIERLLGAETLSMIAEFDRIYDVAPALRAYQAGLQPT